MDEKENHAGSTPNPSPSSPPSTITPSHTTLSDDPPSADSEKQPPPTFAPLRAAGAPPLHRLSIETLSTLRRERSNNGWGVDNIEEDAAGAGGVVAPYNHPASAAAAADAVADPFEVGWEGGDADPLCPRAMPGWRKWLIVGITSVGSFCV